MHCFHTSLRLLTIYALSLMVEAFLPFTYTAHIATHKLSTDGVYNISGTSSFQHPSTGQPPVPGACFSGTGFLLARRGMRWRKDDTCLSEASCVTFSPSLAFACKLRGTSPKITSARERRLTGASPKPITYQPLTTPPPETSPPSSQSLYQQEASPSKTLP